MKATCSVVPRGYTTHRGLPLIATAALHIAPGEPEQECVCERVQGKQKPRAAVHRGPCHLLNVGVV